MIASPEQIASYSEIDVKSLKLKSTEYRTSRLKNTALLLVVYRTL